MSGQGNFLGVVRMPVKLFLLGGPGSGKSTVAHYIESRTRDKGWFVYRINDYAILREMFKTDQQRRDGRFKPAHHGGFDVLDFEVVDEALRELERRAGLQTGAGQELQLLSIEFARNDYQQAFQQFSHEFLQDAYFLYLEAEREICRQRIQSRVVNPRTEDDYYVSDYIFKVYYNRDDGQRLVDTLTSYGIDEQRIKILENNGELSTVAAYIDEFIDHITLCSTMAGVT